MPTGRARRRRNPLPGLKSAGPSISFPTPPTTNARLEAYFPGTSLGSIARATHLNVEYISRIFNLKRRPSLRTAEKIAAFLGVSMDELVQIIDPARSVPTGKPAESPEPSELAAP